jgi:hypothetical protein
LVLGAGRNGSSGGKNNGNAPLHLVDPRHTDGQDMFGPQGGKAPLGDFGTKYRILRKSL